MANDNIPEKTYFAPAEMTSGNKLLQQIEQVKNLPYIDILTNAIPNIYLILNKNRQIVYANQRAKVLLDGASIEKINGLRPGDALDCKHVANSPGGCGTSEFCRYCGAVNAIISSLNGHESSEECRIIRTSGEALDLRVWTTPVNIEGEKYTIFSINDISHEKRRYALERIFFHDIINTASSLRGFAELISEEPGNAAEFNKYLVTLTQRLIDEILAQKQLLAAENDELTISPKSLNTKEIVELIASEYKNHSISENKLIQVDSATARIDIITDPALLMRVLGNMVKNAFEASYENETVTIGCSSENGEVEFWVHNPVVMPAEVKAQIFQRSFSTKGTGRGLGTYSMKLLTEKYLKGKMSFVSSEEEGTIFSAFYPTDVRKA